MTTATMSDRGAFRRIVDTAFPAQRGSRRRLWEFFMELAAEDLPVARLVEAHADAVAILTELGGKPAEPGQYWAVWAAEAPDGVVNASQVDGAWTLSGTKKWCSGGHFCTHALVTANAPDGRRLFAIPVDAPGVTIGTGEWTGLGMRRADTGSAHLSRVAATPVGEPEEYLSRNGFWHGAIGVAACWYGGAAGVSAPLRGKADRQRVDEHGLAHFGAVDCALHAARCVLLAAADEIDGGAVLSASGEKARALRVRAIVEQAATTAMDRVGRALGPGPLAHDAEHAQRVADLTVYVRQSHAERDLAALGAALAEDAGLR